MCLLVAACGGVQGEPVAPPPPSESGFPAIPFGPSDELSQLHESVREPATLRPPRGSEDIWARDVYTPWMQQRTELIALAMQLRRTARNQSNAPAVVAGLHAELLRHTADSLDNLDLSEALAAAVKEPVSSLRERALRTYEVCYEAALAAGAAYDGWHRLCGAGLAALSEND
jgi:hypothetical protein